MKGISIINPAITENMKHLIVGMHFNYQSSIKIVGVLLDRSVPLCFVLNTLSNIPSKE